MTSNEYRLIAYKFIHADDLTEDERDLVLNTSSNFGFDPYNVTEGFLARNLEAFEHE